MPTSVKERVDRRFENRGKYNCTRYTIDAVQRKADRLRHLPKPGSRWVVRDTDLPESLNTRDLRREGIIRKVGERLVASDYLYVYRTTEEAYEVLEDVLEYDEWKHDAILPCCRDSWIKNERGVEGITCGKCGTIHPREELEV